MSFTSTSSSDSDSDSIIKTTCEECRTLGVPLGNGLALCETHSCDTRVFQVSAPTLTEEQEVEPLETREGVEVQFPQTTTAKDCPECGHGEVGFKIQQTRSADESGTRMFICPECRKKWREDD